jgi:predicted nucleic acid-binding Zn ribbon protein
MALIKCPGCGKRISSRAAHCSHCNAAITAKDDEATERALSRTRWKKRKQMQNLSFLALILFLVGIALYWSNKDSPEDWQYTLGIWLLVAGFISYAVLRIKQIIDKFS